MEKLSKEELIKKLKEKQEMLSFLAEKNSTIFEMLEGNNDVLDDIIGQSNDMMSFFSKERNEVGKQAYKIYKEIKQDAIRQI